MKGYLTTCDGAQFELPTLLKWEFSYTGSVPCDSFTLRCAYEPAMAETLQRAVRFTAREDGTVEFAGVVDECGVTCDEKGLQLEVSGRGMAALLLDNEAESVSYQWATMEEILKNHVTPYGIVCTGYDAVTAAARYRVANGSSQWKALNDFAALHGGIAPYFDKTGAQRHAGNALHGGVSDRKVEGGRGDAARDDRGAVHRRAGGYRGGERDEDRHCGQFPRDRVREALWRERRGVRSDDAEGVRDDVAIEKAKPA